MSANLFRRTQFANFAVDMHTITRNALAMTARMAATTVVGLLTWRIALQLLGAYSLGLYSVIAGVIALGEVLYATLGGAYDRYMAYTLGRCDSDFGDMAATARRLQVRVAVAVVVLADTAGLWYVLSLNDVTAAGTWVAVTVFQLALATSVLTILAAPARSVLTALERMDIVARVDITATVGRFVLLAVLLWLANEYEVIGSGSPYPLVAYAIVCVTMPLYTCLALWRHSRRRIGRTGTASKMMMRELLRYAAADFYGNAAVAIRDQGIILVFNAVGGLAATAALTLALAVVAKVQTWAQSILTAFVPPVIKAYAAGDNDRMWRMALRALAWSAGIFGVCAAVLYAFADTLMPLWLGPEMPSMTVALLGIALAAGMCVAITNVFAASCTPPGAYVLIRWYPARYTFAPRRLYTLPRSITERTWHTRPSYRYTRRSPYAPSCLREVLPDTGSRLPRPSTTPPRRVRDAYSSSSVRWIWAEPNVLLSIACNSTLHARPKALTYWPYAADVGPTAFPKTSRCCPRYGPMVSAAERWPCNYGRHVTVVRYLCVDVWHAQMSLQRLTTS